MHPILGYTDPVYPDDLGQEADSYTPEELKACGMVECPHCGELTEERQMLASPQGWICWLCDYENSNQGEER